MPAFQWTSALKLFLPSWNFFSDFAAVPRLEYRLIQNEGGTTDWRPLFTRHTTRSVGRIFFNPAGNLELLEKSLIDRADDEIWLGPGGNRDAFEATETHAALERMARSHLMEGRPSVAADRFRFRLVMSEPDVAPVVVFTSEELPLAEAVA